MLKLFKYFRKDEKGQGLIEYGLILALVSIVSLSSLGGIGTKVNGTFGKLSSDIVGNGSPVDPPSNSIPATPIEPGIKTYISKMYSSDEIDAKIKANYVPISSPDELNNLYRGGDQEFGKGTKWSNTYATGLDKKYIVVSDIDLNGVTFNPIGGSSNPFTGEFDGGGYVINNLKIDSNGNYVGLFGRADDATLKNIGLENANVKGGSNYTGGIAGVFERTSLSNSYVSGNVVGYNQVGGLVGQQGGSSITASYSTGSIKAIDSEAGGIVGVQSHGSTVSNSYSDMDVSGKGIVGGAVAHMYGGTVTNTYFAGKVIKDGGGTFGGLVGIKGSSDLVSNSYYDTQTTGLTSSEGGVGRTTAQMKQQSTYNGWNFSSIWEFKSNQYPTLR